MRPPLSTSPRLDERALRSRGFRGGVPIVLADGQSWVIARPLFADDAGRPDPYLELFDAYFECDPEDEDDKAERFRLRFAMAVSLLLANYDLTPADAAALLLTDFDDEACLDRWDELNRTMMGHTRITMSRWMRNQLLANAVRVNGLTLADALGSCSTLVQTEQAIPANRSVEFMVEAAQFAQYDNLC